MKNVVVAVIGAGYGAELHLNGYRRVSGADVRIKYIVDIDINRAIEIANKYNVEKAISNIDIALEDSEVDIVDICTTPKSHYELILKTIEKNKNIICEKPLIGYFGEDGDEKPIGTKVDKKKMYFEVLKKLEIIKEKLESKDIFLAYAENFVYAPAIQKSVELIKNKATKILYIKGEESLKGSSSKVAGKWEYTGGGSLIRVGAHPLGAAIYLKEIENKYLEEKIYPISVLADVGEITKNISKEDLKYHDIDVEDVEDFANVTITYSNGSKVNIIATDTVLGGTKNYVEVYGNNLVSICNLTPIDGLSTYMLDDEDTEDIKYSEMLPTKIGWNKAFIADEVIRGYSDELKDFIMAHIEKRKPICDFKIAYEVTKIIYAAYYSAEEKRAINLGEDNGEI